MDFAHRGKCHPFSDGIKWREEEEEEQLVKQVKRIARAQHCVWKRRKSVCAVSERENKEYECVHVCVCERDRDSVCVFSERENKEYVCVRVWASVREREKEKERVNVCVCVSEIDR